ncbi:MAG: G5 domain-containing protein [Actinomycetota bacterium]
MSTDTHGRRRAATPSPVNPRRSIAAGVARVTLVGALVASMGGVLVAQSLEPEATPAEAPIAALSLDLRDQQFSSRSALAGRLALEQVPAVALSIAVDGTTIEHSTRAASLADALAEAGITLDADDIASAALAGSVHDGMSVTIQRVEVAEVTEQVVDTHETKRVETDSLMVGTEKITTEGVDGVASHTYRVTMIDGVEVSREVLVSAVASERVDEVVAVGTKKPAPAPAPAPATRAPAPYVPVSAPVSPGSNRALGQSMAAARGWTGSQWTCLDSLWQRESGWNHLAMNPSSGAYGIPQSLPGSKMATVAADWRTNPATQITWGMNYIASRYGTPCGAWSHSEINNWY